MTEEELQKQKEEAKQRRLSNLKKFKPFSELTEEEKERQKAISSKGGKESVQKRVANLTMKEQTLKLLAVSLKREQAEKLLGDDAEMIEDDDLNVQSVILVRMLQEILENGNTKAIEFIRSTSGQEPTKEVQLTADITTEADRSLVAKVSNRLKIAD